MNLRDQAEADLGITLEDDVNGFGRSITVTDPDGVTADLIGQTNDIAELIDPNTGQAISGRLASIALRISSLTAKGLGVPIGITDAASKPWIIKFDDINGNPYTFKVKESNRDRGLGIVTCTLEFYQG